MKKEMTYLRILLEITVIILFFMFIFYSTPSYTGNVIYDTTQAGNVTNINFQTITYWAGIYGNISSTGVNNIMLNGSNTFFAYVNCSKCKDVEIYTSTLDYIDFHNLSRADTSLVDSVLGLATSHPQSATIVFNETRNFTVGPYLFLLNTSRSNSLTGEYYTGLLQYNNTPVYITEFVNNSIGFNNQSLEYQIMLPVGDNFTYYFFIDSGNLTEVDHNAPQAGLSIGSSIHVNLSALIDGNAWFDIIGTSYSSITLYDDGTNGDNTANDGIYETDITLSSISSGIYTLVGYFNQSCGYVSLIAKKKINITDSCGDGICNSGESCSTCSTDCGSCPAPTPTPSCFLEGTPVLMENNSYKNIEDINVDDKVISYDEKNNILVASKVTQTFKHNASHYLFINEIMKVTPEHPLYIEGKWVEAGKVSISDKLLDTNKNHITIESISEIKEKVEVYNIEVDNYHNYFAEDYLVHNKGEQTTCYRCDDEELLVKTVYNIDCPDGWSRSVLTCKVESEQCIIEITPEPEEKEPKVIPDVVTPIYDLLEKAKGALRKVKEAPPAKRIPMFISLINVCFIALFLILLVLHNTYKLSEKHKLKYFELIVLILLIVVIGYFTVDCIPFSAILLLTLLVLFLHNHHYFKTYFKNRIKYKTMKHIDDSSVRFTLSFPQNTYFRKHIMRRYSKKTIKYLDDSSVTFVLLSILLLIVSLFGKNPLKFFIVLLLLIGLYFGFKKKIRK